MTTLLVLGAGQYYVRVISEIQQMGHKVVAIDKNPDAEGFKYADYYEAVDITDKDRALDVAKRYNVDGVMAINDFGVRTAAYVAQVLGLVGISRETADAANDKAVMREALRKAGVPIPDYRVVSRLSEALEAADGIGLPVVMKPTDCGGGKRGVSVVEHMEELEWSFNLAKAFAGNNAIIVESFLDGTEMTVEALTNGGKTHILAMSDVVKPNARYRVPTSINYPACLPEEVLTRVRTVVREAVEAIGIENGASHTEVIVTSRGPVLVEIAARGGGGHIFSTIVKEVCGVNMVQELTKILTGGVPDLRPRRRKGCVYRFFSPKSGILEAVRGLPEARRVEGVIDIGITKKVGDRIRELANGLERVGFLVVGAESRDEAVKLADRLERMIVFMVRAA